MSTKTSAANWLDKSIASESNPVFNSLLDCLTTKGIKKHGLFLASGEKAVSDILDRHPGRVRNLIVSTDRHMDLSGPHPIPKTQDIARLIEKFRASADKATPQGAEQPKPVVLGFSKALFEQLDQFGTHAPVLVLTTHELETTNLELEPKGLEILCAMSDPSNVGALLRTAAAFKASKVILLKESASPFHPRAVRSASAATLSVPLFKGPSIHDLPALSSKSPSPIIALDMFGEKITGFDWPTNARLVIGEEGQGVPQPEAFRTISIPIAAGVESLNATIAASIALYAYRSRHSL
jgi:RNA methyltransferase, TrmH family